MQLSLRLSAIAAMVTKGNRLVDVGCDHGYLSVHLVQEGKVPHALAMDIRKGPLSRAEEHICQFGLSDYIETRLSDGLKKLKQGEGDTLVIAGMGGFLMERILSDGASLLPDFKEMILQPQSDLAHFRKFIHQIGWEIAEEEMIFEDGKFYPVIRAVPGMELSVPAYQPVEECFGRFLLTNRHPVLKQYLERENRICDQILEKLRDASDANGAKRRAEIEEKQQMLRKAMEYYTESE